RDQAHEVFGLHARKLGSEGAHPDVVDPSRVQQVDALLGTGEVVEPTFGKQHLFGVRFKGDRETPSSERVGAIGDLLNELQVAAMYPIEVSDGHDRWSIVSGHRAMRGST